MADREQNKTDDELFRQAMQGVEPLRAPTRSDSKAPRKRTRPENRTDEPARATAAGHDTAPPGATDDDASHRKHGVQARLLQRLKRGHFPPADILDLHHLTVARGLDVLRKFLSEARSNRLRCVRVIHGKGLRSREGPRLKLAVQQALREDRGVLAFTECKPVDGGSGAVDVLLRSP